MPEMTAYDVHRLFDILIFETANAEVVGDDDRRRCVLSLQNLLTNEMRSQMVKVSFKVIKRLDLLGIAKKPG